ncbi:MAG: 50S ribosomal protein L24 [Candidatus Kerfeldbacteria bacterium]|nr:50S ribosomal protein L24 [Candidatus Kerfeldbacteria bacterium]
MNLRTGDLVMILTGKDRGKKGKITQVFPRLGRVVVEGVNQMTKNIRRRRRGEQGQRVQFNAPIDRSKVMLIDPKSGQPTRLGSIVISGKKIRRSVRSNEPLSPSS